MSKLISLITRRSDAGGNPGDVFIRLGLQWLINQLVERPQFILYDKFSDKDFKANESLLRQAEYIIYAGTPQYNNYDDWCLWYDWDMFRQYIIPFGLKYISIAGGAGFPSTSMRPEEFSHRCRGSKKTKSILNSRNKITILNTVRDEHAHKLLTDLKIPTHLLPCTAFWAADWLGIGPGVPSPSSTTIGYIPPNPEMIDPKIMGLETKEQVAKAIVEQYRKLRSEALPRGYQLIPICHGKKEYEYFKTMPETLYTNDSASLMYLFKSLHGVISARLHGALPVAGMNKPSVLIAIDTRGFAGKEIGIPIFKINDFNAKRIMDSYLTPIDYLSCKLQAQEEYLRLFKTLGVF